MRNQLIRRREVLRTVAIGGVAAGVWAASSSAAVVAKEIDVAKVPASITEAADRLLKGAKWSTAYKGKESYDLDGTEKSGIEVSVEVATDGKVTSVERTIAVKDVPKVPMKLIASTFFVLAAANSLIAADAPKDAGKFRLWDGKESVADYAKKVELPPTLTLDLGGNVKWEGVLIPAGTFLMGSPPKEAATDEEGAMEKQHKVTISQPFYIGKFELTEAQYQQVTGANPSKTKGDDLPVHNVSWQDAVDYCNKLGKQVERGVQLPTEAQWEYACRAGTNTAYHNGGTIEDLEKVAWYGANSGGKVHPVGKKLPNNWGVYDMHGNIREFVRDLWAKYPDGDAIDPTGATEGDPKNHVVRGGAYTANAAKALNCRSASRRPTENLAPTGFRIVVSVPVSK